ncbi:recombinase family protein [Streptomyces sp. T028]|uniref:recombinase family protein n=1 Tax=Streptomyces sp. T028 TaxID=3394379 RepID=UPI003A8BBD97
MRAAIYVRLSRETDETTSPERQRAACEALCEARGWNVIVVEEDIDVSSFSRGLDRPGLQRILTRLAELDVIVFFKIDRLARSTVDFAEIMRLAEHQSVALASATEPLDLTSSMGRAMAKVIAVFAELESDTIGMRVSSAHEHLRREGRYTGGRVPYGYLVVSNPNGAGKVLAVNEVEAKTIKRIVERVLAKDSLMQIINDLNKEGAPSPGHSSRQTTGKRSDSKQWYTTTLRSLLGSPQLLGQVIEDGKPILRTDGLPLVNRPPILDTDTWQALQDELERRRYDRGLFRGDDGAIRYAEQYAKLEERLATLKERQRTAKPGGVKAEPTGETHAEQWKRSDVAGKRDLLLNAGGYVEVAPARRGGKKLDTSRLSVYFGEEGHMRRAAAAKESEQEPQAADSQG